MIGTSVFFGTLMVYLMSRGQASHLLDMSSIARAPSKAVMWYFSGSALSLLASVGRIG